MVGTLGLAGIIGIGILNPNKTKTLYTDINGDGIKDLVTLCKDGKAFYYDAYESNAFAGPRNYRGIMAGSNEAKVIESLVENYVVQSDNF